MKGRREKKGREAGVPRWWEAEEIGNRKSAKGREPIKIGREAGVLNIPAPPPAPFSFNNNNNNNNNI